MNGELYDAMVGDFGPIITLIAVGTISIIAILKLGIKFDLNEYFVSRKIGIAHLHALIAHIFE